MVHAILEGRKTQTRRMLNPQPGKLETFGQNEDGSFSVESDFLGPSGDMSDVMQWEKKIKPPFGSIGDRLWVKETFGSTVWDHPLCKDGRKPKKGDPIIYRADPASNYQWGSGKNSQGDFVWRPSLFMPRWASRITLEIVGIRAERLHEISVEDSIAEGVGEFGEYVGYEGLTTPQNAYRFLWESINGQGSWEKNPWVWVIEFKRLYL